MSKSREKVLSVDEWNKVIDDLSSLEELDIQERLGAVKLNYRGCVYYCSLTGEKKDIPSCGNIWALFNKLVGENNYELKNKENYGFKRQKTKDDKIHIKWNLIDPGGYTHLLWSYKGKWLKCWSYDVNSSYSYAMTKPMPNTDVEPRLNDIVKEGEMGFYDNGYATTKIGAYAEYIFPLKESPFTTYVNTYYDKKKKAKFKEDRKKWKYFLNIPSGMLQRHNIFIRLAILYWAREYIKQFIDDNTVYCNVDCIVSLKPRDDLPLGDELGQFKIENINKAFKYLDSGIYQWEKECHYKGIPGCTLTDIENISNWKNNFPYKLEGRRVVKCQRKEEFEKVQVNENT